MVLEIHEQSISVVIICYTVDPWYLESQEKKYKYRVMKELE